MRCFALFGTQQHATLPGGLQSSFSNLVLDNSDFLYNKGTAFITRTYRFLIILIAFIGLPALVASYAGADEAGEWRAYAKDNASTKYSPLDQINRDNFKDLRIVWRWSSVDDEILNANPGLWAWAYEATPIMVNGVLYTSTPLNQVAAIDPVTGQTIWKYDPETYKHHERSFVHRGVAYWADGDDKRIFIGTNDAYLIALDCYVAYPLSA